MYIVCIVFNILLTGFLSGLFYRELGAIVALVGILGVVFFPMGRVGNGMANVVVQHNLDLNEYEYVNQNQEGKRLLISVSFVTVSLKVLAFFGLLVEVGSAAAIALAILLACGFFFEGSRSGMNVSSAFIIGRAITKIYNVLNSVSEIVARVLFKLELMILGIELK